MEHLLCSSCGHALLAHEDVRDPKTGKMEKYAGPCMVSLPRGRKSNGKVNNNNGPCPCGRG